VPKVKQQATFLLLKMKFVNKGFSFLPILEFGCGSPVVPITWGKETQDRGQVQPSTYLGLGIVLFFFFGKSKEVGSYKP
jgi:hypothetical protein